jgi:hypothetical protein
MLALIGLTFVRESDPIIGVVLLTVGIGAIAIASGAGFIG